MLMTNETIRVVVCGDEGVGKSSLITSLIKDTFVPNLQSVLPPITIPPEFSGTPGTVVVDTSSLQQDRTTLQKEIRRASVIWLVYSDHYTCERVSLFWLPFFRSLGVNLPVVLCANMCDRRQPGSNNGETNAEFDETSLADEMVPILKEFKEIESCIRCSAKAHYNVNQAFYLCQRAVTHPLAPLYDAKEGQLKPAAIAALQRVFFLCDADQDGYLSDAEFQALQVKCFGKDMDQAQVDQLKQTLCEAALELPDDNGGPPADRNGISLSGFLLLNKLFAEKGRHETTWGILRRFHYTDSLSLHDNFLCPKLEVPRGASVELSPEGYRFLVDLFLLFDKDNDGGLNQMELDSLFRPTPGIPKLWQETGFPSSTVRNEAGNVTLQGWLAQWSMTTYLDYKTTLAYLALLGFDVRSGDEDPESTSQNISASSSSLSHHKHHRVVDGLKVTRPRKQRKPNPNPALARSPRWLSTTSSRTAARAITDRNVFNCFVVGASGSGKSSLLNAFLNRPPSESGTYSPTIKPVTVVNSVEMRGGKQCYMILEELGELEPAVLENQHRLDECDILCYTYDSSDPDSFAYLASLRKTYPHLDSMPAVYVALKADLDRQQQRCDVQPDVYTRSIGMAAPLHVSEYWPSSLNELFVQLAEAAQNPGPNTPFAESEEEPSLVLPVFLAGGAVAAIAVAASVLFRAKQQN
jgi:Ras family protein T1